MKFILDLGNTLNKVAIYKANELDLLRTFAKNEFEEIEEFLKKYSSNENGRSKTNHAILSSVVNYPDSFRKFLNENFKFIELTEKTTVPVINKYKTISTLGKDRLAAIVGANHIFPENNLLVIDCGTCVTYDIITKKGEYLGGGISPGISMRFRALHNFTDNLPLMSYKNFSELIGNTTEKSILSGVINGTIAEMEGIIERYQNNFNELKIILSGGDVNYFDKMLKNNIFAVPNLVLFGLNIILDYNVGP